MAASASEALMLPLIYVLRVGDFDIRPFNAAVVLARLACFVTATRHVTYDEARK